MSARTKKAKLATLRDSIEEYRHAWRLSREAGMPNVAEYFRLEAESEITKYEELAGEPYDRG